MIEHNGRRIEELEQLSSREMHEVAGGASDYLLMIDGIKGESARMGSHAGGGGGGAGKVSMRDFYFTLK